MVKVLPWPGCDSAVVVPPCAAMSSRTTARPMPDPMAAWLFLPRQKRSKMRGRSAGSMPGPVSVTRMRAWWSTVSTAQSQALVVQAGQPGGVGLGQAVAQFLQAGLQGG